MAGLKAGAASQGRAFPVDSRGNPPPPSSSGPAARLLVDTIAVVTKRDGSHMAASARGA